MRRDAATADAAQAEALYALRPRLIRFFSAKGRSSMAEDLADDAILRVFDKLRAGAAIEHLAAYALGVARHVWLEVLRRAPTDPLPDDVAAVQPDPAPTEDLDCLEQALQDLPPGARRLILRFYGDGADESKHKEVRRTLASDLGISMNALFLRVSKLRSQLARRIDECRQEGGPGGQVSGRPRTDQEEHV